MPQEQDPDVQHAQQQLLQRIVDGVAARHSGGDKLAIVEAIERGIADGGLPPQPHPWLEATASEIAEGRQVVADRERDTGMGPGVAGHGHEAGRP